MITWESIAKYSRFIWKIKVQGIVNNKYNNLHFLNTQAKQKKYKSSVTSPSAPMRGRTLESFLIWATNSFCMGELKNTYALQ
jgi:hypothetical protein